MIDIAKLRGRLVLLEQEALQALEQVASMTQLWAWRRLYILGKGPMPRGDALYTTHFDNGEILKWHIGDLTIGSELVDEAYCRWRDEDREQAELYADVWTGRVETVLGGFQVWIEAEDAESPPQEAQSRARTRATLQRAKELADHWLRSPVFAGVIRKLLEMAISY